MSDERFSEDLIALVQKISSKEGERSLDKLDLVKSRLIELHHRNLVKINHSAMELVCAHHLIRRGYEVSVEQQVNSSLVCDVLGIKGDGKAIVEIETGFIPPEHALDPNAFFTARITSKIARYSQYSDKFTLAVPPYCVLPVPPIFQRPPRRRSSIELGEAKNLCDRYYTKPPITLEQLREARLHSIQIVDVDQCHVEEIDPETYVETVERSAATLHSHLPLGRRGY